jgi:uncharacterized protein (TIGR03086 family)
MSARTAAIAQHRRAVEGFGARVRAIGADQWHAPTPCTEWDVRDLVSHLVVEQLWVGAMLRGETIADVGDRFDGDQLGVDAVAAWDRAAADSLAAFAAPGAIDRVVHLSYGDVPAADYCREMAFDATVHTWDLARATGGDERLDPELVAAARELVDARFDDFRQSGLFGEPVPMPPDADPQAALLAKLGRQAAPSGHPS